MICPFCKKDNDKVVDSRVSGMSIRRRRECCECGRRFTTREYIELQPLTVIKRSGDKEPFQREKLLKGLMDSCKKRPVSRDDLENIATVVENSLPVNDNSRCVTIKSVILLCRNSRSWILSLTFVFLPSIVNSRKWASLWTRLSPWISKGCPYFLNLAHGLFFKKN